MGISTSLKGRFRKSLFREVKPGAKSLLLNKKLKGVSFVAQRLTNLTRIHEDVGFDPWPYLVGWGPNVAVSCGVGPRSRVAVAGV